jgi:hypothetical protein
MAEGVDGRGAEIAARNGNTHLNLRDDLSSA